MVRSEQIDACVEAIRSYAKALSPQVGIILGSGLGDFAEALDEKIVVPYQKLPHFPHSSVPGHAGRLVLGKIDGVPLVAMQGRVHFYEGYSPAQVIFPTRVLARLGIKSLVVTNAAGSINMNYRPGDLMVITDHLNLSGFNPLVGPNEEQYGPRFPDMSLAYHPALRAALLAVGKKEGVELKEGVYAMFSGPSYETPAEIRALRILGADAVGMSTVPEVIAANHMGVRVVGISCLTNLAAGIGNKPLTHEEVAETANRVREVFGKLLRRFIPLAAEGASS